VRAALALWLIAGGCGEPDPDTPVRPDGPEAAFVTEARQRFPTAFEVHTEIIATTCSPNPGVCHSANTYPDLSSFGALIAAIEAPCNVEIPDPGKGWDGCERRASRILAGAVDTEIAWTEMIASGRWEIGLAEAAAATATNTAEVRDADDQLLIAPVPEWGVALKTRAADRVAELVMERDDASAREWLDTIAVNLSGGDQNRNGVWGADTDEGGAVVVAGDIERSYLWGRITQTVPGSRMPLANDPLKSADYVAVACWIETLIETPFPRSSDPINYDDCVFAWFPVDHAIE
jgi:hypothetical protein